MEIEFAEALYHFRDAAVWDVHQKHVLLHGGAQFTPGRIWRSITAKGLRQVRKRAKLVRGEASAQDRDADARHAGLALGIHAGMVAIYVTRRHLVRCRVKLVAKAAFQLRQKAIRRPALPHEEEFQAGVVPALAQTFRVAKNAGNFHTNALGHLLRNEGVQAQGEVRLL